MRHSKHLNSGIINSVFQKTLISEIVKGKDVKDKIRKYSLILKKYNLIREELDVFNQLMESYTDDKRVAGKLLDEIKSDILKKDWTNIEKQRQQFLEEVKKIDPSLNDNLNEDIANYKYLASIKNFLDDAIFGVLNAKDRMMIEESLITVLTKGQHIGKVINQVRESNDMPKEADPLVVNLMIRDFTSKWKQALTPTQYQYLIEYTANGRSVNNKWLNLLRKKFRKVQATIINEETKTLFENAKNLIEKKIHLNSEEILNYAELLDEVGKL